jgi:O-antigen/teichoic acid export membrane protein
LSLGAMAGATLRDMRSALASRTGRATQLVMAGQMIQAVLGFALNVLLLRALSLDDYGLFSLFNAAMMLLAGFIHLGWTETFVRFGAKHRDEPVFAALRARFFRRTLLSAGLLAAGVALLAPWVAESLYGRPDFARYLRGAALGAWLTCFFSFVQSDYRIRQRYRVYFAQQIGSSALRLALCAGAFLAGMLTLWSAAWVYALAPLLFVAWSTLKESTLRTLTAPGEVGLDLEAETRSYQLWTLVSMSAYNFSGNIGYHILAHFHVNTEISSLAAATRLTLPIDFVVTALATTLLPRLSAARGVHEIRHYLSRLKLFLIPFALGIAALCWLAPPLLIWLAGGKYAGIGPLVRLNIVNALVILLANSVSLVLAAWGWARGLAIVNLAQLLVGVALSLWWIPRAGAMGAVAASLAVNVMGLVFIYAALWIGLRERQ